MAFDRFSNLSGFSQALGRTWKHYTFTERFISVCTYVVQLQKNICNTICTYFQNSTHSLQAFRSCFVSCDVSSFPNMEPELYNFSGVSTSAAKRCGTGSESSGCSDIHIQK
jgi:hypothetical protein